MSTVQEDWLQVKPWNIISKGQIWAHPHNKAVFSLKNHCHLSGYVYWLFPSPKRGPSLPKESDGPKEYIPTWLSRKFHRLTLNRYALGRSGNRQAQTIVKLAFFFYFQGSPIHGKFSVIWQWVNTLFRFTMEVTAWKAWRQWFSRLAWHQYWCHLGRSVSYWCHPGDSCVIDPASWASVLCPCYHIRARIIRNYSRRSLGESPLQCKFDSLERGRR